ncbi:MAG: 6-bladed beta-propeller [Acidobacteria bacterium]|nr:MAG: 6-bladed beta-propeller [Acidobacteriota bacterium]
MKIRAAAALVLLLTVSAAAQQVSAPAREIPFDGAVDFLKLPPGMNFGEVAGVAVNSKGHFFIYDRARVTRLLEFDRAGAFVREIGKDVYGFDFAHVVRIDKDDNIWCVDEGANVVIKFNPLGRVTMVLGRKWESVEGRPSQEDAAKAPARTNAFNRPTDVTWDPAGNIYVADGYNNSRVVKFDKLGNWLKTWGERGSGPGQFNIPHTIASDAAGNVYVGDRTNRRIQVFDGNGTFLRQFANVAAPWAICITPGAKQFLYSADANSGKVFKLDLEGNLLGAFGSFGKQPKQFGWIHEIACPSENELYVGELLNWRVQKLTLKPFEGMKP